MKKYSDEQITALIEQGFNDADVAKALGAKAGSIHARLKTLRGEYNEKTGAGINYGKIKAAEYAKEHARVEVEEIMAEINSVGRANQESDCIDTERGIDERYYHTVEAEFIREPNVIESRIRCRADQDIADYQRIKGKLVSCIEAGQTLMDYEVEAYNDFIEEYGGTNE